MQRAGAAFRPALRSAAVRRAGFRQPVLRSYATATEQTGSSHLLAGVAGGAIVLGGVYGYYHYSGAKKAVDSVQTLTQSAQNLKDKAASAAPSPQAMLGFVRSAAHSYAAVIPGAAYLVDSTFDQIDKIAEKNGPEVERIVKEVYSDISKAVSEGGDNASDKVMAAVQEAVKKIQKLSSQLSSSTLQPLLDKNPQLKSAVNDTLSQISSFGDKYGPEAQKIAQDTVDQIKKLTDEGINASTIAKATSLAKQKLKEIQDLGAKAGKEAYSKAAESAGPYLEKAPDVKKYLDEKLDGLKEYVGDDGVKLINDTYKEIEEAGKKGDTKKLMEIVKKRIGELEKLAKDKGGDLAGKAADAAKDIPGADKLFAAVPSLKGLGSLRELAQEKGGDFEKLLQESYDEIKEVLEKRAKQAEALRKETANEAKKKATK